MKAVTFAIIDCGFSPRCSLKEDDSGKNRYSKIVNIVRECRYGIHDLSRTEVDKQTQLPRFNMPLELGIFLGAKEMGGAKQKTKRCLILDNNQYHYQKTISDLSGHDIKAHNNSCSKIIRCVRDWLSGCSKQKVIPGGSEIHKRFKQFMRALPAMCRDVPIQESELIFNDYIQLITTWIKQMEANVH